MHAHFWFGAPTSRTPYVDTRPLVSAADLAERLMTDGERRPTILDVRWELGTGARPDLYAEGHIPGAAFVDLDAELAGPVSPSGAGGRHPLPTTTGFDTAMRRAGVDRGRAVVVYDAATSTAAARAWWLLRYFGHRDVAVLDGGLTAWLQAGGKLEVGPGPGGDRGGDFVSRPGAMPVLDAAGAAALAQSGTLLDARAAERFRGESEPVDPVAGRIPGARNRPTTLNLTDSARFLEPAELRDEFARDGVRDGVPVGVYCGSGVTAAHEVLALELAGRQASLYPGSWSDWISDPARPVASGKPGPHPPRPGPTRPDSTRT
jgi:thiosulfate/3-mercaptopyruvate sulfurtransferase